jgi:hypothetical protein
VGAAEDASCSIAETVAAAKHRSQQMSEGSQSADPPLVSQKDYRNLDVHVGEFSFSKTSCLTCMQTQLSTHAVRASQPIMCMLLMTVQVESKQLTVGVWDCLSNVQGQLFRLQQPVAV